MDLKSERLGFLEASPEARLETIQAVRRRRREAAQNSRNKRRTNTRNNRKALEQALDQLSVEDIQKVLENHRGRDQTT